MDNILKQLKVRNHMVTEILDLFLKNKVDGDVRIQVHNDKFLTIKDFKPTCASICNLYDRMEPSWRNHIIGIRPGEYDKSEYRWELDAKGSDIYDKIEKKRFN